MQSSNRSTQVTQQLLMELFIYFPDTGVFTRRKTTSHNAKAGGVAGCPDKDGYLQIWIGGKLYKAHRLAWMYVHGAFPDGNVDHINGVTSDNRMSNIRVVDHTGNGQNQRIATRANMSSGLLGAYKKGDKWCSKITVSGKRMHIGTFDTKELAHDAYVVAKRELHKTCTI